MPFSAMFGDISLALHHYILIIFKISDGIWRWMLLLAVLPAIGLLVGILAAGVPESPRWLVTKGLHGQALEVLRKIRKSEQQALDEFDDIAKTAREDQDSAKFRSEK